MTDAIKALEQDIEQTRARLDHTIYRLQDRLSASGIVDDVMGAVRTSDRFGSIYDEVADVVRRNPVPVILMVVGAGWLIYRLGKEADRYRLQPLPRSRALVVEDKTALPTMNDGTAHLYDPDVSPRHPAHDRHESRRDLNAHA